MGWLGHQLLDIIEWTNDPGDTLLWHFPRYENEIKYGAKLVVREGQSAAFVNEGKLADVFGPGTYTLATQNLPILADLKGWKYGFQSPFKADVYFVSTRTINDRKWGTKNPIMMRDAEFGAIRLRAFGTFAAKVSDPATLLRQASGAASEFTVEQIESQLRDLLVARFADSLAAMKLSALDLAGNYDKIARYVAAQIQPDFATFGMQIVNLMVENISLPAEVEAAIDKRSSMGVIGNMQAFTQYQTATAIPEAAANPGGMAAAGAGVGIGFAMANQLAGSLNQPAAPPPVPLTAAYYVAVDGKQAGPFDLEALRQKVAGGQVTRQTLVWKNGMPSWQQASAVGELAGLFNNAPPPLPV
ncbi:MAG TPA: SPFH domain-containing protein [Tepidisphaeraceae bacterium]|nr:SPFH domain-containing protein [Tepidisphaeraceae bacterium]